MADDASRETSRHMSMVFPEDFIYDPAGKGAVNRVEAGGLCSGVSLSWGPHL